jgi:hypothetical protein
MEHGPVGQQAHFPAEPVDVREERRRVRRRRRIADGQRE